MDLQKIAPGLKLGDDGIWYAERSAEVSYPEEGNALCYQIEDQSFWFRHRNNCITTLIQAFPPAGDGPIFDIGGGNGCVARAIQQSGCEVVLLEPGPAGVRNARRRGVENVICSTFEDARFLPESIPAAGLFDVIEHIHDDRSFLNGIRSLLTPGGHLYLTAPAFPFLWSDEDADSGHYRRYTAKTIAEALGAAGFRVEFQTYVFRFLPLPVFFLRTVPSWLKLGRKAKDAAEGSDKIGRDHAAGGGVTRRILDALLAAEADNIRRKRPMRLGGSCLVVARRL